MKLCKNCYRCSVKLFLFHCIFLVVTLFIPPHEPAFSQELSSEQNEARFLTHMRQLIFEGSRSGEGYFSADGSLMIFQSEREPENPFYQIYIMNRETGDTWRVSPGMGKTTCSWIHRGGKKVLFSSTHEDPAALEKQKQERDKRAQATGRRYEWSFDEYYDIYEADLKGNIINKLTHEKGYDAEGSWSPDGSLILFASNREAYESELSEEEKKFFAADTSYFLDIYLMNADGTEVRRLTNEPGYDGGPFFSPDGKKIVWRHFSKEGMKAEVWIMNIDGSDKKQITGLDVMSWAPYFHPSGDYIIFTCNTQGFHNFELYIVDSEGASEPVRVTTTDGFDGLPVFTPDGKQLSWASSRTSNKKPQIFIAQWNDKEARCVLNLKPQTTSSPHAKHQSPVPDLTRTAAEIRKEDLKLHVEHLASERLEGRLTGTNGEKLATEYAASVFKSLGLTPAGDKGTFFQSFTFTAGVSLADGNTLTLTKDGSTHQFAVDRDWRPLSFSRTGNFNASEIVFAGYGIAAPASGQFKEYDSYEGLDVKGKWVMIFRFMPEDITPEYRQYLSNYFDLRFKAMIARDKGAQGIIVVNGPNAQVKEQLIKLSFDTVLASTSMGALSITDNMAQKILTLAQKDLKTLQDTLDTGKPFQSFVIPGLTLSAAVAMKKEKREGRNVLARLMAGDQLSESMVVIGAHIDHIGRGIGLNSLAREDEQGKIHYGADDNASGTAALLEIAQYLTDQKNKGSLKLKRDILFAAFSGEELGMLGSDHFVSTFKSKGKELEKLTPYISAYVNMDMIGRLDKTVYLQGVGSSSVWLKEIEKRNAVVGIPITPQKDSYLPTDATSFYLKGVPILSAFTGTHSDYNTPRDSADRINYEGIQKIASLMGLITRSLAVRDSVPDYSAAEKPAQGASRRNIRVYLGTIPDYGESDVKGVRLSGVVPKGPASEAGLKQGDIITSLAGRKIENIYDFTHALQGLKVGQTVKIEVQRDGEQITLSIVPESRQ